LALGVACLAFTEMTPSSRGVFFFCLNPADTCFWSISTLAISVVEEPRQWEGWEGLAVRQHDLGVLCEKKPVLPRSSTRNHASAGEKRSPAEVRSASRDGADVELLPRVGLGVTFVPGAGRSAQALVPAARLLRGSAPATPRGMDVNLVTVLAILAVAVSQTSESK